MATYNVYGQNTSRPDQQQYSNPFAAETKQARESVPDTAGDRWSERPVTQSEDWRTLQNEKIRPTAPEMMTVDNERTGRRSAVGANYNAAVQGDYMRAASSWNDSANSGYGQVGDVQNKNNALRSAEGIAHQANQTNLADTGLKNSGYAYSADSSERTARDRLGLDAAQFNYTQRKDSYDELNKQLREYDRAPRAPMQPTDYQLGDYARGRVAPVQAPPGAVPQSGMVGAQSAPVQPSGYIPTPPQPMSPSGAPYVQGGIGGPNGNTSSPYVTPPVQASNVDPDIAQAHAARLANKNIESAVAAGLSRQEATNRHGAPAQASRMASDTSTAILNNVDNLKGADWSMWSGTKPNLDSRAVELLERAQSRGFLTNTGNSLVNVVHDRIPGMQFLERRPGWGEDLFRTSTGEAKAGRSLTDEEARTLENAGAARYVKEKDLAMSKAYRDKLEAAANAKPSRLNPILEAAQAAANPGLAFLRHAAPVAFRVPSARTSAQRTLDRSFPNVPNQTGERQFGAVPMTPDEWFARGQQLNSAPGADWLQMP